MEETDTTTVTRRKDRQIEEHNVNKVRQGRKGNIDWKQKNSGKDEMKQKERINKIEKNKN